VNTGLVERYYLHSGAPLNDPIYVATGIVSDFLAWSLIWVTGRALAILGLAFLTARVDIVGHGPEGTKDG
jgi:hypothetical protein